MSLSEPQGWRLRRSYCRQRRQGRQRLVLRPPCSEEVWALQSFLDVLDVGLKLGQYARLIDALLVQVIEERREITLNAVHAGRDPRNVLCVRLNARAEINPSDYKRTRNGCGGYDVTHCDFRVNDGWHGTLLVYRGH